MIPIYTLFIESKSSDFLNKKIRIHICIEYAYLPRYRFFYPSNITHLVYIRLCSPLPTLLSPEIKYNCKRTPQDMQTHIHHDWRNISALINPIGDELTKTVSPQVLVDCDVHEERSGDGFVAIDSIGTSDGRKSSDLNTRTGVADDDNNLYFISANNASLCL
jgi:hypothetical protein